MTQSIIVYRNPAEAALWESGMMFPIIVGMVVGVASVVLADKLLRIFAPKIHAEHGGNIVGVMACVMTLATIWFML